MHNIRVLREKMGLSQQQVAEAVHVSQQAVARWESGLAKPRADLLPQLASLFNRKLQVQVGHLHGRT